MFLTFCRHNTSISYILEYYHFWYVFLILTCWQLAWLVACEYLEANLLHISALIEILDVQSCPHWLRQGIFYMSQCWQHHPLDDSQDWVDRCMLPSYFESSLRQWRQFVLSNEILPCVDSYNMLFISFCQIFHQLCTGVQAKCTTLQCWWL